MIGSNKRGSTSREIGQRQREAFEEELREAVRGLLMSPLLGPQHDAFTLVYRHADTLREWFLRETGWMLEVERGGARLYKRPADLRSATRGFDGYDRRRYVLFCLACAVLERADPQITLRLIGERLLQHALEPELAVAGFSFSLSAQHERRELVSVCRALLDLGVLIRLAGEEDAFVQADGEHADALYDINRRALSGVLASVRGPSLWRPHEAPTSLDARLKSLVDEHIPDSDEGRRTAVRHYLARRMLDDPAVYLDELDSEARAYFMNQRGTMAARLCETAGLVAEQRAEGLALVDETGALTDVAMPAEGTDAHATLLVADFLARGRCQEPEDEGSDRGRPGPVRVGVIVDFLREAKGRFGKYWRKSARVAGAESELAATAIERLEKLHLLRREGDLVVPRPALARFALGETEIRKTGSEASPPSHMSNAELELT